MNYVAFETYATSFLQERLDQVAVVNLNFGRAFVEKLTVNTRTTFSSRWWWHFEALQGTKKWALFQALGDWGNFGPLYWIFIGQCFGNTFLDLSSFFQKMKVIARYGSIALQSIKPHNWASLGRLFIFFWGERQKRQFELVTSAPMSFKCPPWAEPKTPSMLRPVQTQKEISVRGGQWSSHNHSRSCDLDLCIVVRLLSQTQPESCCRSPCKLILPLVPLGRIKASVYTFSICTFALFCNSIDPLDLVQFIRKSNANIQC